MLSYCAEQIKLVKLMKWIIFTTNFVKTQPVWLLHNKVHTFIDSNKSYELHIAIKQVDKRVKKWIKEVLVQEIAMVYV